MRELSMHILDLAQNSIAAEAKTLEIEVIADTPADRLTISLRDDGKGMAPELLASVKDPFTTTRTTRRVGLGVPMLDEAARACEGDLSVQSEPGKGTEFGCDVQAQSHRPGSVGGYRFHHREHSRGEPGASSAVHAAGGRK